MAILSDILQLVDNTVQFVSLNVKDTTPLSDLEKFGLTNVKIITVSKGLEHTVILDYGSNQKSFLLPRQEIEPSKDLSNTNELAIKIYTCITEDFGIAMEREKDIAATLIIKTFGDDLRIKHGICIYDNGGKYYRVSIYPLGDRYFAKSEWTIETIKEKLKYHYVKKILTDLNGKKVESELEDYGKDPTFDGSVRYSLMYALYKPQKKKIDKEPKNLF